MPQPCLQVLPLAPYLRQMQLLQRRQLVGHDPVAAGQQLLVLAQRVVDVQLRLVHCRGDLSVVHYRVIVSYIRLYQSLLTDCGAAQHNTPAATARLARL